MAEGFLGLGICEVARGASEYGKVAFGSHSY